MNKRFLVLAVVLLAMVVIGSSQSLAAAGDWMVRGRLIVISPDASSTGEITGLDVDSDFTVEVDINYFFTDHIAIEAIAATAAHTVELEQSPMKDDHELDLGSASILPPTILIQYHFLPDGKIRPYIGAGINYTVFYNQSGFLADFEDLDSSFGFAAQAGIDFMLSETMSFNVDLKYIDVSTDVVADGDKLAALDINPMVIGFGVGWRF